MTDFQLTWINKIEEDIEPDFDAIRKTVNEAAEFIDEDANGYPISYEKEEILNCVKTVEDGWNGNSQDAIKVRIYDKETLFSGGNVETQAYKAILTLVRFPDILEEGNLT